MHEITHTTGDAILHGWRRTTRRWKARKKLKYILANQRYRRSHHAARRAQRRKFICYFFRNHWYCSINARTIGRGAQPTRAARLLLVFATQTMEPAGLCVFAVGRAEVKCDIYS